MNYATSTSDAKALWLDANVAEWDIAEERGTRYLSERDFPIYDSSADDSMVPDSDWEAFFADSYSDPMEWVA